MIKILVIYIMQIRSLNATCLNVTTVIKMDMLFYCVLLEKVMKLKRLIILLISIKNTIKIKWEIYVSSYFYDYDSNWKPRHNMHYTNIRGHKRYGYLKLRFKFIMHVRFIISNVK